MDSLHTLIANLFVLFIFGRRTPHHRGWPPVQQVSWRVGHGKLLFERASERASEGIRERNRAREEGRKGEREVEGERGARKEGEGEGEGVTPS